MRRSVTDEAVYKTAIQFEKDVFNPRHMYAGVRRILHQETIDIDELVAFLKEKRTDRKVSDTSTTYCRSEREQLIVYIIAQFGGSLGH